ncbi:hypothetical protein [Roseateles sp. BYS87W]|uniref:Alpha/beta hydrolase n=1 Tax=Pelomonas baiyunensis TaxID=3299026 RepID=A0ABW7GZ10_9BURK
MPLHRPALPLLTLLTSLALAACAGGPPAPRPWAEVATRELQLQLAQVEVAGRPVGLTLPRGRSGPLPVVVYLPGLGQAHDAGQRWAAGWAQAGYAVLTVQPLAEDADAWRTPLARSGEFRALGERHYGAELRTQRQAAVAHLLHALRRLPTLTSPALPPVALDWQHAALAGYETGAQAVLDLVPAADGWRPRAVIAISPPPMDAAPGLPAALLVTSDVDGDALGLVTRPADRQRALASLPAGELLNLGGVSHAALSGTLAPEGWHTQDQHRGREPGLGAGQRGGMNGGMGGGPMGPAGGAPRGPRSGSATEAAQADLSEALRSTVAFLNTRLRG